jgi:hypothetical protein
MVPPLHAACMEQGQKTQGQADFFAGKHAMCQAKKSPQGAG